MSTKALAPSIDPLIREYVRHAIREALTPELNPLLAEARKVLTEVRLAEHTLTSRVEFLEKAIKLTPPTRRKLEALIEALNDG